MTTKYTQPLNIRFVDDDRHEAVRKNTDARLTELQQQALASAAQKGVLVAVKVVTVSGPYTPTPGATTGVLIQCGGGGAGGGATAVGATLSIGGGGASGITLVAYLPRLTSGNIVIGAAGVPGAPGAAGGNGGSTTTTINGKQEIATGGGGGGAGNQSGNPAGAQGGAGLLQTGSTAGLWVSGDSGVEGLITSTAGGGLSAGGRGGSGALGAAIAAALGGFGAGGAGGTVVNGSSSGSPGGAGVVVVVELT